MSEMVAELKAAATVPPRSADLLWCAGFGGIVPFVSRAYFYAIAPARYWRHSLPRVIRWP